MIDSIQQQVWQLLPIRRRMGQNGWLRFNAPCCIHNGETQETRMRGGIISDNGAVSYHCFNCGYKSYYKPGYHLSYKFRKLLQWLGADDLTIRKLVIDAIRVKELIAPEDLAKTSIEEIVYETRSLPEGVISLNEWTTYLALQGNDYIVPDRVVRAVHYINHRHIDINKYQFYLTDNEAYNLHRRIIIPYYYKKEIVGYTARTWEPDVKPKYWSSHPADFVFNLDNQLPNYKFVIVCEGPFDAMSIDGVALNGSEVSDIQVEQIDRLQREVIVVPDSDRAGRKLVDRAVEVGWTVSFPLWQETCKDINEAVIKYGKLFVLKSILAAKETNRLKIELKKKKLYAQ